MRTTQQKILVSCQAGHDIGWKVLDETEAIQKSHVLTMTEFGVYVNLEISMTAKQLADIIDRDRSTAYRALEKLVKKGLVKKTKVHGRTKRGYVYEYWKPKQHLVFELIGRMCNMGKPCRMCQHVQFEVA